MSVSSLEKKFKRERKEITKNEKEQKEFIKDLEVVFNDFMDMKFDPSMSAATKKQFESDEETLREMLKKMVKLTGMKAVYVEKCKEWLREMLRTGKRKRPQQAVDQTDKDQNDQDNLDDDFENEVEDDIIMYDSDNDNHHSQSVVKKRKVSEDPVDKVDSKEEGKEEPKEEKKIPKKRGRKPKPKLFPIPTKEQVPSGD